MSDLTIVLAIPADYGELARLIEAQNRNPATQCLHSGEHAAEVAEALARPNAPVFMVARRAGQLTAAFGCEVDGEARGFLQGPFVDDGEFQPVATELWQALHESTPAVTRYDAFINQHNQRAAAFYSGAGFRRGQGAQIYVLPAAKLPPLDAPAADLYSARCRPGVVELHQLAFPDSPEMIDPFIEGEDENRRLFVCSDGDRCLGYIAASINDNPREGYIDLLAVNAAVRNRGFGRLLLLTAAHWLIREKGMPQVGLTVLDMRSDARRLYARAGFELLYSGVGYFRQEKVTREG